MKNQTCWFIHCDNIYIQVKWIELNDNNIIKSHHNLMDLPNKHTNNDPRLEICPSADDGTWRSDLNIIRNLRLAW